MCDNAAQTKLRESVVVLSNVAIAPDVWMVKLEAPQAAVVLQPGQFVHLFIDEKLTLRRPFSVCRVDGSAIFIMYAVVGKGTRMLTTKEAGDASMNIIAPCGNRWPLPDQSSQSLLVGGGLGAAPLGMFAHELFDKGYDFHFIQAARNADLVIGRGFHDDSWRAISYATDDGTLGYRGLITEPVREKLASEAFKTVYVCGPEIMQRAVVDVCKEFDVDVYVSLERLMACGIGACLSCNVLTKKGPKKVCVDGPIFDARDLEFSDVAQSSIH